MANRSTGIYGHFGSFSATNQLPNVAGADLQTGEVQVGDLAAVAGALYICTTATLGAAVWAAVGAPATPQVGYVACGTYSPTLTSSGDGSANFVDGDSGPLPFGWVRWGNGAGVAQSGDFVKVFGLLSISTTAVVPTNTFAFFSGPFAFALGPFEVNTQGFELTANPLRVLASINPGTGQLGVAIVDLVDTASPATISFSMMYQIA